jgi:hypothetical protein
LPHDRGICGGIEICYYCLSSQNLIPCTYCFFGKPYCSVCLCSNYTFERSKTCEECRRLRLEGACTECDGHGHQLGDWYLRCDRSSACAQSEGRIEFLIRKRLQPPKANAEPNIGTYQASGYQPTGPFKTLPDLFRFLAQMENLIYPTERFPHRRTLIPKVARMI